jgi:hypothetical protein
LHCYSLLLVSKLVERSEQIGNFLSLKLKFTQLVLEDHKSTLELVHACAKLA